MLPTWRTRFSGQILLKIFALTLTWAPFCDPKNLYEIKFKSDVGDGADQAIFLAPEECVDLERYGTYELSLLNTEGNCLELWSKENCQGTVMYYVSSGDDEKADISWDHFPSKSAKLCEIGKQPSHRIVRRGLVENSTEYYFWAVLSKIRGRSEIFLEEFRKGSGHPDWETILGGRNWQGPRSKLYLKALYKVVNVFKTYCSMDMKWSRYTTRELAQIKQLAADVVRLREVKALKFPYSDPQSKVHAKIVAIWKNITITLERAHDLKMKYDQSVKLAKLSNVSKPIASEDRVHCSTLSSKLNQDREVTPGTTPAKVITTSSTKSKKMFVTVPPQDESYVRIID